MSDLEARFSTVYRREGPRVLRYLYTRARDRSEAEDLHAETFCRAWQAWARFQGEDIEVRAWLFRIARNLLIDRHRRRQLLWFMPLEDHHRAQTGDEVASRATGLAWVREVMTRVSAADGELLVFRAAGLSHAEIGSLQGRSEQAVKIAWHRALERLRGQWILPELGE